MSGSSSDTNVATLLADNDELRNLLEAERERLRAAQAQASRFRREIDIATEIQMSILPRSTRVEGYDVAAKMVPTEEVGGDYFDVIGTPDACWLGIGDVSGHGLTAGLIMLMTQCAFASLVRHDPDISPPDAIAVVNEVLFENIRRRLQYNAHMTLTLLRLDLGGGLRFAGAHEDLLIRRKATGLVEHIETPGTWVGAMADLRPVTPESTNHLAVGDLLVLISDGIIEARVGSGQEQYGRERLTKVVIAAGDKAASEICQDIFDDVEAFAPVPDDDRTVVVVRRDTAFF